MSNVLQRRDKIIPWYFVMFFAGIFAVNAVMITLAFKTRPGLVTEHPYEKGLAYNAVVTAEKQQEQLGWKSQITYEKGLLQFTLSDRDGKPLVVDGATARFTRLTHQGLDFELVMDSHKTRVEFPQRGLWEVRIRATRQGVQYQQAQRIVVE